ncbi:hypothetical protein LJ707_02895 [Mucilaginibacter sp. UR6-1]|uniref:sensor histidine kinase n=1 Tax=Mucilaginibacter sp. UR6-1 TaxID=1435643 RepID=UPI001E376B1F|nr:sensor histidine kinase [Mucilaginibacter sp. UR6-1]MCC8407860.1 hypothetical protein [Mucilaginibacter sp. UR6-1]
MLIFKDLFNGSKFDVFCKYTRHGKYISTMLFKRFWMAISLKNCFSYRLVSRYKILLVLSVAIMLTSQQAICQIDLKNSLYDLKSEFIRANTDTQKVRLALSISSFYLTNKVRTKAMADSSRKYIALAQALNNTVNFKDARDAIRMLQFKILLRDNRFSEADRMIAQSTGPLYCHLNFLLGRFRLEKPGSEKEDMELAEKYFLASQQYAVKKGMPNIALISQVYQYNLMVERGVDENICNQYLNQVLKKCRVTKSKQIELKLMQTKAVNDLNHYNLTGYMYKTATLAKAIGNKGIEIFCLKEIADYNLRQGKIDSAEQQLNTVLKMYTDLGFKNLQFTYDLLAATALVKGNMESGMKYSIAAVKTAEQTGTDYGINSFYNRLAGLCRDLGMKRQSLMWYRKWQEAAMRSETSFPYAAYSALAAELILQGKAKQVLKTLDSADKAFKFDPDGMFLIPQLRANCYAALGKMDSAEFYSFKIVKNLETRGIKDYLYYQAYQNQAAFYIKQRNFIKASPFVDKVLAADKGYVKAADMAALLMYKFKVDSAQGNYLSAINYFKASKAISDSIYNQVKIKQTEQLQLQYATAERDHENLVLRSKNNLQHSELEKEALNRKLVTTALLGSILITGLMWYLYRAKQKSNTGLKLQQDEINKQNKQLQLRQNEINKQNIQLNQLLHEKEWLMKEIHHRVKNNLQIISSLLNTQSSYLDNEEALMAIRDSQNRMQAISIVHQKLYQSDDLSTINLQVYIEELAQSIQNSFQNKQNINFNINIANARLSTAQTVPLGLILNEAITNSVKYAFTETRKGLISLYSSVIEGNNYKLIIKDNGKGLPEDFDIHHCTSLGLNLISGLAEQLGGQFDIQSNGGTTITVIFPIETI